MELTGDRVADVLAEAAEAEKNELDKKEDGGEIKEEDEDKKKEKDDSEKPSAAPKLKAKAKAPSLKRPAASTVKPVKKQKPGEKKETKKEKKEKDDENEDEEQKDEEAAPSKAKAAKAKAKAKSEKKDKDKDEKNEKKDKDEKKEKKGKDEKKEKKDKDVKEKKDKDKKSKGAADQEKAQALVEIEDEEEEENEGPKEGEPVKRDSKKAWYFHRHFDQLPDSVKNLFNSKDLSRKQKSGLVNDCVVKDAAGSWALQPDNPTVSALSSIFKKIVGGEYLNCLNLFFSAFPLISLVKFSFLCFFSPILSVSILHRHAKGIPKALMVAKLGGELNLQEALKSGDIVRVTESLDFSMSLICYPNFFPCCFFLRIELTC